MQDLLSRHRKFLSEALQSSLEKLRRRCDKKSIHHFRVLVKKIKAFFLLIEFLSKDHKTPGKDYRKLKKLYKTAGEIRISHVHNDLLKEFNHPMDNASDGHLRIKKMKKRLTCRIEKFAENKNVLKLFQLSTPWISNRNPRKLTAEILAFSKSNIKKAISLADKRQLHQARMKLKTAHYCLDLIAKEPEAASLLATIDPIEQKAGRWHDCVISREILSEARGKNSGQKNAQALPELNEGIEKESARLESQLHRDFIRLKRMMTETKPARSPMRVKKLLHNSL